ncbi:unconventional myosin-XV [Trichonephila clavata]|uniref:Unconventional myosin-XV n=1 Tax=Trichonephila clavata TaxID=2740835 RepID=A0A8X6HPC8_TRICU|nr:unconventional myosin-XV [Trichonephila clavata]
MNREEKRKLQQLIDGYGVTSSTLHSNNIKLTMKRNVVDVAKEFPNYFSRLFPISGGRNLPNVQLLGVSHSGVRLVRRERDAICDYLRVLDTISFEDIAEVSVPRSSTIQILLRNGGWMTLYSHKAEKIRNMVERYCVEAAQGGHEYVRAVADYVTRESTLLSFRENDIIRVVKNRNLHLDKAVYKQSQQQGYSQCLRRREA